MRPIASARSHQPDHVHPNPPMIAAHLFTNIERKLGAIWAQVLRPYRGVTILNKPQHILFLITRLPYFIGFLKNYIFIELLKTDFEINTLEMDGGVGFVKL